MKIRRVSGKINLEKEFVVNFDVGAEMLTSYAEIKDGGEVYGMEDEFRNRSWEIRERLGQYKRKALEYGYETVRIVCEPTGGYEKRLFDIGRELGCPGCYVNGESVSKFKSVESNDYGKTDQKDPRIISTLAKLGKTLTRREIPEEYARMKMLGAMYAEEDRKQVVVKNHFSDCLKQLFWDGTRPNDFYFMRKLGRTIAVKFKCNPYLMAWLGFSRFSKVVRGEMKIGSRKLEKFWEDVVTSAEHVMPAGQIRILERQVESLYGECERHEARKKEIIAEMLVIYRGTREGNVFAQLKGVVNEKFMAQLIAQTGPLSDFGNIKQLLRYCGLNIAERRSGKYKGKFKITKRGNGLVRKVLFQIAFWNLIGKKRLFGDVYNRDKERLVQGMKAMVSVMRKFMKMILGLFQAGGVFEKDRVFMGESEFHKVA